MKKIIKKFFAVVSVVVFIWLGLSVLDVNAHNNAFENDYGKFSKWNAFIIFTDILEGEK